MPRLEDLDCRDGHGQACKSRPWNLLTSAYCICGCHHPLLPWARRRWSVSYVYANPAVTGVTRRRYFTYRGALRVAASWNRHNHGPGVFEVFGPPGKGED